MNEKSDEKNLLNLTKETIKTEPIIDIDKRCYYTATTIIIIRRKKATKWMAK